MRLNANLLNVPHFENSKRWVAMPGCREVCLMIRSRLLTSTRCVSIATQTQQQRAATTVIALITRRSGDYDLFGLRLCGGLGFQLRQVDKGGWLHVYCQKPLKQFNVTAVGLCSGWSKRGSEGDDMLPFGRLIFFSKFDHSSYNAQLSTSFGWEGKGRYRSLR